MASVSAGVAKDDNTLVSQAKSGDTAALTRLLERYSDIILQKAKSFKGLSGIESDDLYQEGMMGLVAAVYSFNETREIQFSTYAVTVASRKMLSALKKSNNKSNLPLRSYISIEEENNLLSFAPTPEEIIIYNEELDKINNFIKTKLSKTEKKVLKLSMLGMSYSEIADILECTEKSVDNAIQRIRRKIRDIR